MLLTYSPYHFPPFSICSFTLDKFNNTNDLNSFLFSDDTTGLTNASAQATTNSAAVNTSRGSLLSLMQNSDLKPFEFTSILQSDAATTAQTSASPSMSHATTAQPTTTSAPQIALYDNNHFDLI